MVKISHCKIPFICPINNKEFNTYRGLSSYITKTLNMEHEYYYNNYISPIKTKCFFCENNGKFISIAQGYRDLCTNDNCIKKARTTYSIDGIMYKYNCIENEAEIIYKKIYDNNKKVNKQLSDERSKGTNYLQENSNRCIEFWIKKGFSEEESLIKVKEIQTSNGKKLKDKLDNNSLFKTKFCNSINTNINYYINKGFTKDEALIELTKRQTTFSLAKCIEKHGDIDGLKIWEERQNKWQTTLNNKTDEEKQEINRKRLFNYNGFSKQSQLLFWEIYNNFNSHDITFYSLNNKEMHRYNKELKKHYLYDYVDHTNKKVIEYNGDFWHCNPKIYDENYYHKIMQKYAKDIWEQDKIKNEFIINMGYDLLIIWESDFKQNKEKTIQLCIDFINNKTK